MSAGVYRGQEKILDTMELELVVFVACPAWVPAIELTSSARAAGTLIGESSTQTLFHNPKWTWIPFLFPASLSFPHFFASLSLSFFFLPPFFFFA